MADLTDGVPFLPAVHFHAGRDGRQVDMLILHWMSTDLAGADATFTGGGRVASAHYGIQDGAIHQYVHEADASYNAADWDANMRSIAIEHSAAPGREATAATVETSVQVCLAMMRKYPAIGDRVYPHFKFVATQCPGTLPWEHIRDEALRRVHGGTVTPVTPPAQEDFMATMSDAEKAVLLKAATTINSLDPYFRATYNNAVWNHADLIKLGPQVAVLQGTIAALLTDPDITPEALTVIIGAAVRDAIAAQVTVHGTLTVDPKGTA